MNVNITLWSVDSICVDSDSGRVDATVTVVGGDDDFYRIPETFVMRMPKTVALELFAKGLAEMAKQKAVDICKEVQE